MPAVLLKPEDGQFQTLWKCDFCHDGEVKEIIEKINSVSMLVDEKCNRCGRSYLLHLVVLEYHFNSNAYSVQ